MRRPSGDQRGLDSPSSPCVSWRASLPSASIRQTWLNVRFPSQSASERVKTI